MVGLFEIEPRHLRKTPLILSAPNPNRVHALQFVSCTKLMAIIVSCRIYIVFVNDELGGEAAIKYIRTQVGMMLKIRTYEGPIPIIELALNTDRADAERVVKEALSSHH